MAARSIPIGWGHQIRSYVLTPYRMVKDLRTGVQRADIESVLDGDIDDFMRAALALGAGRRKPEHSGGATWPS